MNSHEFIFFMNSYCTEVPHSAPTTLMPSPQIPPPPSCPPLPPYSSRGVPYHWVPSLRLWVPPRLVLSMWPLFVFKFVAHNFSHCPDLHWFYKPSNPFGLMQRSQPYVLVLSQYSRPESASGSSTGVTAHHDLCKAWSSLPWPPAPEPGSERQWLPLAHSENVERP